MSEVVTAATKMKPEMKPKNLPLEELIRQRAHAIYLQRGGQDGSELDDWLQAEEDLREERIDEASMESFPASDPPAR